MGEQVIRRGHDTWVESAHPAREHGDGKYPQVISGSSRVLLFMPLQGIKGRTVLSATLAGRVRGATPAQTLTVKTPTARWSAAWANWNNQPAVGTASATVTIGALADQGQFEVAVGALVQSVANGADHFGWRIETNDATGAKFCGFDSDLDSWTLTVVTSDAPQQPTTLYPADGVIGIPKWTVSTDFTDLGGSTEMASMQVQVSPTANPATAYDTGEVATTVPELDLARTDLPGGVYGGLASGALTQWRARVKDTDGMWSAWSDWVSVTYIPKPTLILDNPASGLLGDPTTTITAHITSGALKAWRVRIANGADKTRERYDSRKRDGSGTTIAHALPFENSDGQRIFRDDKTYWLNVRAWDRLDRLRGGVGDLPYMEVWQQVLFDEDVALAPISGLNVTQIGDSPRTRLSWSRTVGAADAWAVYNNGQRIARLDPTDVTASAGTYEWVTEKLKPNMKNEITVRAIVNGAMSKVGPSVVIRPEVKGVWLLSPSQGDVVIEGTAVGGLRSSDRRATYSLPGKKYDVDIIGALGGVAGDFAGTIDERGDRPDAAAVVDQINAIRQSATETVQLVYATRSVPVLLRNLSVDPAEDFTLARPKYDVTFYAQQVGDFDGDL